MHMAIKSIDADQTPVRPAYLEALTLVERLHRRLLDVIKDEFDRRGRADVNAVQALLLYNIADKELTAGELRTRGYYLGSNVSYNVKKLVESRLPAPFARSRARSSLGAHQPDREGRGRGPPPSSTALYEKHVTTVEQIGGIGNDEFAQPQPERSARLERFWTDQIKLSALKRVDRGRHTEARKAQAFATRTWRDATKRPDRLRLVKA